MKQWLVSSLVKELFDLQRYSYHMLTTRNNQRAIKKNKQNISRPLKFSSWPIMGGTTPSSLETTSLESISQLYIYIYICYVNCPILDGSGFIMAPFKQSWQDGLEREKLSALSCSMLYALSLSLSFSLIRSSLFPPFFFRRVVREDRGVVSKSSSQLLSPHQSHSLWHKGASEHLSSLSQTPAWTHVSHSKPSQYSRMGTWTVIVCLHYLCQCTDCGKWHRNAIIHSCRPAPPSIRLMIFRNRPGFPGCWNHECEK